MTRSITQRQLHEELRRYFEIPEDVNFVFKREQRTDTFTTSNAETGLTIEVSKSFPEPKDVVIYGVVVLGSMLFRETASGSFYIKPYPEIMAWELYVRTEEYPAGYELPVPINVPLRLKIKRCTSFELRNYWHVNYYADSDFPTVRTRSRIYAVLYKVVG